ncbi:cellulose biosynthesis protein BcsD [Noviherbaspirillum saxi]|nr:hypothetical protein [Noviherbaspirillum saxi]
MAINDIQQYFRTQQVPLQWLPILRAMAIEMSAYADAKDLHHLFFNIGERFAKNAESHFQGMQSLDQLEESLNDFWSRLNWGWVDLNELKGYIDITHQAAPLAEAFGDEALGWSVGFLEGFYQTVFAVLGASNKMVVRSTGDIVDGMELRLRFGR